LFNPDREKGGLMMNKLILVAAVISFSIGSAEGACIFGGGAAGQSAAYHYTVAYINSTIAADAGLKRASKVGKEFKPADDYQSALVQFS
jgi:hypothetical protein